MKFFKTLTLALGAMLALAACSSGPNLGKEVTVAEFEASLKKAPEMPEEKLQSVKMKMDYVIETNATSEGKMDLHADFTLTENTKEKDLNEAEIMALYFLFEVDYSFVKSTLTEQGVAYKTYMGENPTTYGVTCDSNKTLEGGVVSSLKGTYQWNQYGTLSYMDEVNEIKSGEMYLRIKSYFKADYTFSA